MSFVSFSHALAHTPLQRTWLVNSLIERDTMAMMTGSPASGKSFLAVDLACSLVTGTPWLGYEVPKAVPVYYLSSESPHSVIRRMEAWRVNRGYDVLPDTLHITPYATTLATPGATRFSESLVDEMSNEAGLLIVDTWSRALPGINENSAQEISSVIQEFDYLRKATGSSVLVVHHTSKGTSDSRGSGALPAAMDTIFHVEPGPDNRELSFVKNKDGGTGIIRKFRVVDTAMHVGVVDWQ